MDDFVIYLIFGLIIIVLFWLYIAMQIAMSIVVPKVRNLNKTIVEENERDHRLIDYYQSHKTNELEIESAYKYPIHIYEMIQDRKIKKFVVISHGYTYSHHGSIKYAKMMIDLGFNAILYDHRYHGLSGGKNTTLGFYERNDLKQVIDYAYETYGEDIYLGTYGESMGSSTCLLEQAIDSRVKFVISDAGFKSLKLLIKKEIKRKKLPVWLFYGVANLFVWLISKANMNKVNPIEAIKETQIPMMFVHGKLDNFIPYQDAIDMYESYQGPKHLFLAETKAYHARSYYHNKETYFTELKSFVDKYLEN